MSMKRSLFAAVLFVALAGQAIAVVTLPPGGNTGDIQTNGGGFFSATGSLVFNVKDAAYGAKGNGDTDDGAAIAAAITAATASTAMITMTIASPTVVTWTASNFTAGQPITFSTSGALPTGLVSNTLYYVSTTGLGANSFQIADTRAHALAGTNSINATGTQSGTHTGNAPGSVNNTTVYLPCGTYNFASGLTITEITHIRGAGTDCTYLNYTGAGTALTYNYFVTGPVQYQTLENLTLKGPYPVDGNANASIGLLLGGTSGAAFFRMNHVYVRQFGTGVKFGNNSYLDSFDDSIIAQNLTAVNFPNGLTNAGENIMFNNTEFDNCGQSEVASAPSGIIDAGGAQFTFIGSSILSCQAIITANSGTAHMSFLGTHFEWPGGTQNVPNIISSSPTGNVTMSGTNSYTGASYAALKVFDFNAGGFGVYGHSANTGATIPCLFCVSGFASGTIKTGQAYTFTNIVNGSQSGTVTMTIATPAVVTWTNSDFQPGQPISFSTSGALPTGVVAGTIYYVSTTGLGVSTFQIADTAAHAVAGTNSVATSGTQSGTQTGNTSSTGITEWMDGTAPSWEVDSYNAQVPVFRSYGSVNQALNIDASTAAQSALIQFMQTGVGKWQFGKLWNNHFLITDQANAGATAYDIDTTGNTTIGETNKFEIPSGTALPVVSACGTAPAINGSSTALSGDFTTGTGTPTTCTVTFVKAFNTFARCAVTPAGAVTPTAVWRVTPLTTAGTTGFTVNQTAQNSVEWSYVCSGY
jgi:hypothetical protein